MNLFEFLQDLVLKGWKFWNEDNRVHYRAPKEESNSLILAQLKQHKAEILQLLQKSPDILNVYPLSYGQKALWFLWQLTPESYAYNVSFTARICSVVDITAMEKAFGVLRERHPILRTTFPKRGSEPIQQVHQNQELDFLEIDASTWSEDELKAKVVESHQLPFDLERGPVMRVRWFTRSNQEHVLLLTIHHIACDGWSIDLLIQELPQLYQAQKAGVEESLTPLKHSYQDYVRWQRDILQGTEGEKLWNYWQQKLAGELLEWNDTETEYPSDKCIHQLFEEQVERTPDAVAVVFENQQLTYQQLNQIANQLAHHLQSLGVGPEVLVGICVERSLEMVVGLLGILKAGGAYVPLDPNYPQERLSYMLADSGVEVLLTQSSLLESLPEHQAQVVCLDSDWGTIEQNSLDNLELGVGSDNLAYVIYTSGSTGQPKGVMITHQALSHFTQTALSEYEIKASDRVLQFASINFDAAVEEIYPCLSTGATLVLRTNEMLADLRTFFQACKDLQLTVLDLPTAYWHQLVADLANANVVIPESLRLVIIGGEKVLSQPVRYWQQYIAKSGKSDRLQLINTYGPTETTVSATLYRIGTSTSSAAGEVPIGSPLAHLQAYILNSHLQPVPIGVPGELYIGGNGLARGYLNRPQLTQEKFIPNPFSNSQSERLYKTGDLVRYLSDGNIEFLGRIDNQVKIRGFRIELGEIEAVLNTHPQIRQAVVIAREDISGNKRLVAYVVSENESLTTNQLREFLKRKLPEYMVPSAFVTLETLPLTPNGKVDTKALPAPDGEITREHEYVAPRTPTEEIVANIFASVLGIQAVGIHDNFFELGGHSLLAVRLMSQIQQQFQINLPLATLFQSPTIEQLASLLRSSVNTSHSILVPIKTSGNQPPLFCIHPGGGNILGYADLALYLDRDYPVYGLQSLGLDGQQQPLTDLEEMASHYLEAIQQIQPQGPLHLIGWCMGGLIAYEMAQQLEARNEPVALLALIDSYAPTVIPLPSEIDEAMIVNQLAQDWGGLYGQELNISLETLRKLEPSEQVKHLFEQAKQQAIFPPEIEIEQIQNLWEVFEANVIAIYHYQAKAYPGSIILLNASETPPEVIEDPTHGWGHLVLDDIQTHTITGDHYTIMKAPQVECLTEKLNKHLKLIQSKQDREVTRLL